jgi:hypothetical protein
VCVLWSKQKSVRMHACTVAMFDTIQIGMEQHRAKKILSASNNSTKNPTSKGICWQNSSPNTRKIRFIRQCMHGTTWGPSSNKHHLSTLYFFLFYYSLPLFHASISTHHCDERFIVSKTRGCVSKVGCGKSVMVVVGGSGFRNDCLFYAHLLLFN